MGLLPSGLKQILLVVAGVFAFLVVNVVMYLGRCTSTEFMVNCWGGQGTDTWHVLTITGVVIVAALATKAGRAFAKGFFGTLIVVGFATMGACVTPWLDPAYAVRRAVEPYRARWMSSREHAAMRRDWIAAMNGRSMDVTRGVELAGSVVSCAQSHVTAKGRIAATREELALTCRDLEQFGIMLDPGAPTRYVIPVARGEGALGEPIDEVIGDSGWRADYSATATGYSVNVVPDGQLNHRWPRIHSDEAMRWQVRVAENGEPLPLSPVADLQILTECLKGIPAEVTRRTTQTGGINYGWFLTSMAKRLCPSIASRLRPAVPNDENTALLSILLPAGPNGTQIPVATYIVEFVIRQPANNPFAFDLRAHAQTAGLQRYLATFEGPIHQTVEPRAATAADPVVR